MINSNTPQWISVGQLTHLMKSMVEPLFKDVFVVGEISNFSRPKSGHCYFTLKDADAQLSAVIWKSSMIKMKFQMKDGLEVLCRGRIEIYPPQGKYQLIVSSVEPKGIGGLELAFKQLKEKLAAEGLFQPERKKAIPEKLRSIALITSGTGAAVRDFLNIFHHRSRRTEILLVPVQVQGEGSAEEVASAIEKINRIPIANRPDAVALIRGGGSAEDLWTFNEERVVRAVAASAIPIITGIGHEVDISLVDLAADLHALTPSDAAARLAPEDRGFDKQLDLLQQRIHRAMDRMIENGDRNLKRLKSISVFQNPEIFLIDRRVDACRTIREFLQRSLDHFIEIKEKEIKSIAVRLNALSPLSVLGRGYSLTQKEDGTIIRNSDQVSVGEMISTKLSKGTICSRVEKRGEIK
ncbi:MAG: exodeoxyribonuclease VII large subunit [Planctomycetia bacterium]|nr:exodeoxyribonuclease VII large subunit [Planctomycetia bacterium]